MPEEQPQYGNKKRPSAESLTKRHEKLRDKAFDYLRVYMNDTEQLRQFREEAMKAYRGDPYPEDVMIPTGSRSKFVMSDVQDTIEWIMPSLMRIFYGGTDVVKLTGRGPEDDLGVNLLNEKVNWDIRKKNQGFLLFYDWFKASMLEKFSVVKYWWDNHDEYKEQSFEGATEAEMQVLMEDPDFIIDGQPEVIQGVSEPDPMNVDPMTGMPLPPQPVATYNVKGRRIIEKVRCARAEVLPPEEFIGSLKARDWKDEEFVAHKKRMHKFDLMKKYNLSEDDLSPDQLVSDWADTEIYTRYEDLGGVTFFQDQEDKDFYYLYECYLYEEKADRRVPIKLCLLGLQVVSKEDNTYGHPPVCSNSPIRMPHRAIGRSIAELVMDLQKLRSALARYLLNNIYYQTENMAVVNPWKIHVSDFLTNRRPGGVIRTREDVDPSTAIFPFPPQPLAGHAYQLLESIESWRESRTGVTRYSQGLNAESLNKTATGISQILAASQQRVELIARIFAETGVSDLMTAFAEMNVKFLDIMTNVRLNQEWLAIDPAAIDVRYDADVDVALGTGSKDTKIQQLTMMLDRSTSPALMPFGIISPGNVYELMKALYVELGYKNNDKFITPPPVPIDPMTGLPMMGGPLGPAGAAVPPGIGAGGPPVRAGGPVNGQSPVM